ncbi:MAG: hypothetical protein R3308_05710, partial [Thiohalobacterales bacterium]|nr:hypothetical protein [Thiohalobacterales bacterium]
SASAQNGEKRRVSRMECGTSLRARLSFGYFSLAEQRKVPRPGGAKPAKNKKTSIFCLITGEYYQ